MGINVNGKTWRNLEEQVLYLTQELDKIKQSSILAKLFEIKGQVNTADQLPNPETYPGDYGDGYLVGEEGAAEKDLYIFIRPTPGEEYPSWFNIGPYPVPGPQGPQGVPGPQGPQGSRGSKWTSSQVNPSISSSNQAGDQHLNVQDGSVFEFVQSEGAAYWDRRGSIRGPQGLQGPQGSQGPQGQQGPQGPQGPQGSPAPVVDILGTLSSIEELPSPETVEANSAYLITNSEGANELYIIINGLWTNTGRWGGGSSIYAGGEFQQTFNADTKLNVGVNNGNMDVVYVLQPGGTPSKRNLLTSPTQLQNAPLTIPTYQYNAASPEVNAVGGVLFTGTPRQNFHCANKKYVDDAISSAHNIEYHKIVFIPNIGTTDILISLPSVQLYQNKTSVQFTCRYITFSSDSVKSQYCRLIIGNAADDPYKGVYIVSDYDNIVLFSDPNATVVITDTQVAFNITTSSLDENDSFYLVIDMLP